MNDQGFIVLHRKLLDWKYFMFSNAVSLWVYIILRANWKDGFFLGTEIPRGSFATSIAKIAADTGLSESTVRRWLKRFEDDGQIERKATNRCTIIKVSNYTAFQDIADVMVTEQMNERMKGQVTGQMTDQVTGQMTPNRTKEQRNKETKEQIKDSLGTGSVPDLMEVVEFVRSENLGINPEKFFRYYEKRGWMTNGQPVIDWKKLLRSWARSEIKEKDDHIVIPMPAGYAKRPTGPIDLSTMPERKGRKSE